MLSNFYFLSPHTTATGYTVFSGVSVVTKKLKHFWAEQCRAEVAFSSSRVLGLTRRPTDPPDHELEAGYRFQFERQTDATSLRFRIYREGLSKTEASCTRKNVDDLPQNYLFLGGFQALFVIFVEQNCATKLATNLMLRKRKLAMISCLILSKTTSKRTLQRRHGRMIAITTRIPR